MTAENGRIAWEFLSPQSTVHSPQPARQTTKHTSEREKQTADWRLPTVDLIISDIMMPEMDGYQLLEKLKNSDQYRGTPVIMLTALADLKDKLKALRIGVDDYMTKPFEEEELLARIDNLLRNRRERKLALGSPQSSVHSPQTEGNRQATTANPQPTTEFSEEDGRWLQELETAVQERIGEFDFTMEQLAFDLSSNRWTIYRRIKQLTGLTAAQYLKEIRLNHARHLLEQNLSNSVKSLSYDVGMRDVKYFSRQFKERFGKLPSEYL